MDIGFIDDEVEGAGGHHWSHILVPGELKSNPRADTLSKAWIDLATYVREVFAAQDTRRFVLGFTLCGPMLRLWEFDRLGGMAAEQFNINEPKGGLEFVAAMLGFLWINKEGLGFDPCIMESRGKRFIDIERDGKKERLIIDELIWRARGIACRGTTCWKAHREGDPQKEPLVIKESWQYIKRDEEGLIVKEATEKGVINIPEYYHHETVHINGVRDDIRTSIRKGLDTATTDAADTMATATSTMSAITARERKRLTSSSASSTSTVVAAAMSSSRRRGRRQRSVASEDKKTTRVRQILRDSSSRSGRDSNSDDNNDYSGSSSSITGTKRRPSEANLDDDDDDGDNDDNDDDDAGAGAATAAPKRPAKRSCSQSVKSADTETNRIHVLLVYKGYGPLIYKASSPKALLEALESCIRAHESLRLLSQYLHRDISINNLLTKEDGPDGRRGILIDFDLAIKEQRIKHSGAKGKTGTRSFMAIRVLMGEQHSFMHDLESFFWVLFWICVHYVGPNKTRHKTSSFNNWNTMCDRELAGAKMIVISDSTDFCKEANSSFTTYYKPLIPLMD
ncbi:hypothetical protein V8C37DRAFT_378051 [Trichoderma ceciliae]